MNIKRILLITTLIFSFGLLVPNSTEAAYWKSYTIQKYLGGYPSKLLLSDGVNQYVTSISTLYGGGYYSFSSLDEGYSIAIDTGSVFLDPMYGDDVYYDSAWGSPVIMTVSNFPDELNLHYLYVVEDNSLYNTALVRIGSEYSIIDYSYGCLLLPEGTNTYLDSYDSFLSVGDTIYTFNYGSAYDECTVTSVMDVPDTTQSIPAIPAVSTNNSDTGRSATNPTASVAKPKKPEKLKMVKIKKDVKLEWKKSTNSKKYEVTVQAKKKGKWVTLKTYTVTETNKRLKDVKKGEYRFKVRGVNGSKRGDWSEWKSYKK